MPHWMCRAGVVEDVGAPHGAAVGFVERAQLTRCASA